VQVWRRFAWYQKQKYGVVCSQSDELCPEMNVSIVKCWASHSRLRYWKRTFPYRFKPCRFGDGLCCTGSRNMASHVVSQRYCARRLGTNLIHDFTAVTFSVKLAFFREKRPFPCFREIPWNPWFFANLSAFTFIYEGFQSFINSFCADFAVCYVSHFSTKQLACIHCVTFDRFLSLH